MILCICTLIGNQKCGILKITSDFYFFFQNYVILPFWFISVIFLKWSLDSFLSAMSTFQWCWYDLHCPYIYQKQQVAIYVQVSLVVLQMPSQGIIVAMSLRRLYCHDAWLTRCASVALVTSRCLLMSWHGSIITVIVLFSIKLANHSPTWMAV